MGATPIGMPSLGMTMEEGTVVEWPFDPWELADPLPDSEAGD